VWHVILEADLPLKKIINSSIGHSQVLAPESSGVENARNTLVTMVLKSSKQT